MRRKSCRRCRPSRGFTPKAGVPQDPAVAGGAHEATACNRGADGSTHDQKCRHQIVNADEVPDRLDSRDRVREICNYRHARNRSERGSGHVVTEAHTRRSKYPIERWEEGEEDSSHKDRPEGVSSGVLVKRTQSLIPQEKARLESVSQKIASQAKGERRPHKGRCPAIEKSSEGTEQHAPRSDYEDLWQVQQHAENAGRDEEQYAARAMLGDSRAQRVKANPGAQTEGVMQPEYTCNEEDEQQRAQPAANWREPSAHERAAVFQRSFAPKRAGRPLTRRHLRGQSPCAA
jgi:hypothetical protein